MNTLKKIGHGILVVLGLMIVIAVGLSMLDDLMTPRDATTYLSAGERVENGQIIEE